eukprot:1149165-Pelagomonas_calceolata.AAC.10
MMIEIRPSLPLRKDGPFSLFSPALMPKVRNVLEHVPEKDFHVSSCLGLGKEGWAFCRRRGLKSESKRPQNLRAISSSHSECPNRLMYAQWQGIPDGCGWPRPCCSCASICQGQGAISGSPASKCVCVPLLWPKQGGGAQIQTFCAKAREWSGAILLSLSWDGHGACHVRACAHVLMHGWCIQCCLHRACPGSWCGKCAH